MTLTERRRRSRKRTTEAPGPRTRRAGREPSSESTSDDRIRVRRFDADRTDVVLTLEEALSKRPGARQLLWIDITGDLEPAEAERVAHRFDLDPATTAELQRLGDRPHLALRGEYLDVRVNAEPNDRGGPQEAWLDVIAGGNLAITHHGAPLRFLEDIDERINADTRVGRLDGAAFLGSLLESVVTRYFEALDAIQDEVDRLDARSLRDDGRDRLLEDLVALRHRIARLRRLLTDQRGAFAALAGPEVVQVAAGHEAALEAVASRFESALGAVEDSRDVLLGSFEVYMTRTAQRTNEVMKVLALATVLLLPGSLIAGLLGMNVTVPLSKDDPMSFWIVVFGVVVLAVAVIAFARARRWL
jgi:Mg2+ and Co2+ transporter CorA